VGKRKLLRTGSYEVDMWTLFKHQARSLYWIAEVLDACHSASFHSAAIHQECIELHSSVGSKEAAAACVESRIVFENSDGRFDGIEGRSALGEDGVALLQSVSYSDLVGRRSFLRDGPSAAMNE
jgi:hypothetical protein